VGSVSLIQIGQNIGGFRQNEISVLDDRHIILTRRVVDLRPHSSAVGHDDIFISHSQLGQLFADDVALRTPINMEKR